MSISPQTSDQNDATARPVLVLVSALLLIVLVSLVDLFLEAEFNHQPPLSSLQGVDLLVSIPLLPTALPDVGSV